MPNGSREIDRYANSREREQNLRPVDSCQLKTIRRREKLHPSRRTEMFRLVVYEVRH